MTMPARPPHPFNVAGLEAMILMGCSNPDCDHALHDELFLHPRCHPKAGTWASYKTGSKVVRVVCKTCRKLVCEIQVSER